MLYLAIFFVTIAFFEVEIKNSNNKLAKKALKACSNLADKVAELNQTKYGTLGQILNMDQRCLYQVEKDGMV